MDYLKQIYVNHWIVSTQAGASHNPSEALSA